MELFRKACSFILGMSSSNGSDLELESPSNDSTSPPNEQVVCINSEDKATSDSLIDDSQLLRSDQAPPTTTDLLQDQLEQSAAESTHESKEEPIVSPVCEVPKSESESSVQDTEETATTDIEQPYPEDTTTQETTCDGQSDKQTKSKKRQQSSIDVYAGYSQPSKKQRKRRRKLQQKVVDQAAKSFNDVVVHYDQSNIPEDLYKYVNPPFFFVG